MPKEGRKPEPAIAPDVTGAELELMDDAELQRVALEVDGGRCI